MAHVAVFVMWVWDCPFECGTHLKHDKQFVVDSSAQEHLNAKHGVFVGAHYVPTITRRHWAFNVRPDAEQPRGSPGAARHARGVPEARTA